MVVATLDLMPDSDPPMAWARTLGGRSNGRLAAASVRGRGTVGNELSRSAGVLLGFAEKGVIV